MQQIIILGGSHAGISTAHRILKQNKNKPNFKITLVTPNSHLYWNIGSPRGLTPGSSLASDQLFQPIAPGFAQYGSKFELVLGTAETVDVGAQRVVVRSNNPATATTTQLHYDYLIVATGSRSADVAMPFKNAGTTEAQKAAVREFRSRVEAAADIVVAGAGITGVELVGELGQMFGGRKNITLITTGTRVLPDAPENVGKLAGWKLEQLGVKILSQTKVSEAITTNNDDQNKTTTTSSKTTLRLTSGATLTADMYIPTVGLEPCSSFLAPTFLDRAGYVKVDDHMAVKGARHVYALGDVCDMEGSSFMVTDRQSGYVAGVVGAEIASKPAPAAYKPGTTPMMGLSIGPDFGTGHFGSWKLPSVVVTYLRKNMFLEKMGPMIDGSAF